MMRGATILGRTCAACPPPGRPETTRACATGRSPDARVRRFPGPVAQGEAARSVILLLLILVALLADVLAPFAPNEVFLMDRLQGSSARYPLGTDQLGRAAG